MKKNSIRVLLATLCMGTVIAGCESKENVDAGTKEETEISGEAADLQPTEAVEEEPTKEAEETPTPEEEEAAEEGFVFPDPMPEIVNASFADGKIQVCDMIVDIVMCNNPHSYSAEEMEYFSAYKMGTVHELYDKILNWGWLCGDNSLDMNQAVINESSGKIEFFPPEAEALHPASKCPGLIWIVYYNNSGEMKKLEECDAFVVINHISNNMYTFGYGYEDSLMPYVYLPGGINIEDSYWNYTTVTDYLKENGIEYREEQRGSSILISFEMKDIIEDIYYHFGEYEIRHKDLRYTLYIDASNMDLNLIKIGTSQS